MSKFNVGDRVKLVKVDAQDKLNGLKVDMVGKVVEQFGEQSSVDFDNWNKGWGINGQRWNLLNSQIKKLKEKVNE